MSSSITASEPGAVKIDPNWRENCLASMDRRHYYPMSPSCQIQDLADHYEIIFGCKNDGVFVELGGYDGQDTSNTAGLADIGWRGIYVEPVPEYAERCRHRHPGHNIKIMQYCVGRTEGTVDFSVTGGEFGSSAHPMLREQYSANQIEAVDIKVHQKTVDQILSEADIAPGFDLLIIDIEGNELEALMGFDLRKYQPKVMIVELFDHWAGHNLGPLHAETRRYIIGQGYRPYLIEEHNTIFVPNFD
ncbi:MAG: FkbM family methyltransferase [Alphaproteobacteria bacterium]|nr:FkbM family methyltransferase [Alphaproteobacteria bacterium]